MIQEGGVAAISLMNPISASHADRYGFAVHDAHRVGAV